MKEAQQMSTSGNLKNPERSTEHIMKESQLE